MELEDLRIFREVVRRQSMTQAAARLHMGQPAVSQRMMALEAEFGKALFVRHRRGVRLTEAGERLLVYADKILHLTAESLQDVQSAGTDMVRIGIAAPSTINAYLLPALLDALHRKGCHVTLRDAHSHEVMQYVLDGSVDAGFVIDIPTQPGIRRTLLAQDPVVCFSSQKHPLAGRTQLSLSDLANANIAFYRFSHQYDPLIDAVHKALPEEARGFVEATPAEAVKSLVREYEYVSFAPQMTVRSELERGEFVALPISDMPFWTWDIAFVYRDRKELPAAVNSVLAVLDCRQWDSSDKAKEKEEVEVNVNR